jgi:hypothetical protein
MQAVVGRAAGDHPLQHVSQPGFRVEPIQFCRVQKRSQDRPGLAPALVAAEQRILFSDCNRADRPLDRVRIRLEPSVVEERRQAAASFARRKRSIRN